MLAAASRLALPGLLLSLVTAAPALAQSRSAGPEGSAGCYRTIADRSGAAASSRPADVRCAEPRERIFHGGWLGHAIMMVGEEGGAVNERPRPASVWRDVRPDFAVPPDYR